MSSDINGNGTDIFEEKLGNNFCMIRNVLLCFYRVNGKLKSK